MTIPAINHDNIGIFLMGLIVGGFVAAVIMYYQASAKDDSENKQ